MERQQGTDDMLAVYHEVMQPLNEQPAADNQSGTMKPELATLRNWYSETIEQIFKCRAVSDAERSQVRQAALKSRDRYLELQQAVRKMYAPKVAARKASDPPHSRGGRDNFPKDAVAALKRWLEDHFDDPYPSVEDKEELAAQTGLTYDQVSPIRPNHPRFVAKWKDVIDAPLRVGRQLVHQHQDASLEASTTSQQRCVKEILIYIYCSKLSC